MTDAGIERAPAGVPWLDLPSSTSRHDLLGPVRSGRDGDPAHRYGHGSNSSSPFPQPRFAVPPDVEHRSRSRIRRGGGSVQRPPPPQQPRRHESTRETEAEQRERGLAPRRKGGAVGLRQIGTVFDETQEISALSAVQRSRRHAVAEVVLITRRVEWNGDHHILNAYAEGAIVDAELVVHGHLSGSSRSRQPPSDREPCGIAIAIANDPDQCDQFATVVAEHARRTDAARRDPHGGEHGKHPGEYEYQDRPLTAHAAQCGVSAAGCLVNVLVGSVSA